MGKDQVFKNLIWIIISSIVFGFGCFLIKRLVL
jgi:hypothetical protein